MAIALSIRKEPVNAVSERHMPSPLYLWQQIYYITNAQMGTKIPANT